MERSTPTILLLALLLPACTPSTPSAPSRAATVVRPTAAPRDAQIVGRRASAMPRGLSSAHPHPRLMATDEDLARVQKLIGTDPVAKRWADRILAEARRARSAAPIRYDPARGIECARQLQKEVTHLALAYRLTGDASFLDRARSDLLAAAAWPGWDQPSFLATAETTTSVAIGYDWLYEKLSADDHARLRDAIVRKGLQPGLNAYRTGSQSWVEAHHNWNLVCNGGMIVGALAVMDESPKVAREVLASAQRSIANGLSAFAPDGGWEEGPTYWSYATRYLAYAVASLRGTFGTLGGFESFPGVARTGAFRMHTVGPTGQNFNFADSSENPGDSPQMFALAWACQRPEYAAWERRRSHTDPSVFDLLWYQGADAKASLATVPTGAFFRGVGVAAFRAAWDDPDATYVAFKGGSNRAHHGHLDLGTFVLDASGQRWAIVLGSDSYDLPAKDRWSYYRYATRGHNTLTLDGANQLESAEAPLVAFHQSRDRSHAVADLTKAYGPNVRRVLRGVALLRGKDVLVQDEIVPAARRCAVQWAMHTRATIDASGRTATLRQNGKTLIVRLLSPPKVTFAVEPASAPPPQDPNRGVRKLVIQLDARDATQLAVVFTPGETKSDPPRLTALSKWQDDGKLDGVKR
jgi:hypothetical protein